MQQSTKTREPGSLASGKNPSRRNDPWWRHWWRGFLRFFSISSGQDTGGFPKDQSASSALLGEAAFPLNIIVNPDELSYGGSEWFEHVKKIIAHLGYGAEDLLSQPRFAPSIVVRTEAELFGVSAPRFACRCRIGADSHQLVNLRRLKILDRAVGARYRSLFPVISSSPANPPPALALLDKPMMADALLAKPSILPSSVIERWSLRPELFSMVKANLLRAYGEGPSARTGPALTSYLMTSDLSGGVCAQACCFMASVLLSEHAHGVCGLAEITYLAKKDQMPNELVISGLSEQEMADYFRAINLSAIPQAYDFDTPDDLRRREIATALGSYLASNFPVVATVSQQKLVCDTPPVRPAWLPPSKAGTNHNEKHLSLYELNDYPVECPGQDEKHAILFVGVTQDFRAFWLHDPSHSPFLVAFADHIIEAGFEESQPFYIPITPGCVKVPLLGRFGGTPRSLTKTEGGLLARCEFLDGEGTAYSLPNAEDALDNVGEYCMIASPERRFWLVRLADLTDVPDAIVNHLEHKREHIKGTLQQIQSYLMKDLLWHGGVYLWLEFASGGIRVFHAQLPISEHGPDSDPKSPEGRRFGKSLPVVARFGKSIQKVLEQPTVDLAAITSFTLEGMKKVKSCWEEKVGLRLVELYTFMQEDLGEILRRLSLEDLWSEAGEMVVPALALLNRPGPTRTTWLEMIKNEIVQALPAETSVACFCSFIPELMGATPTDRTAVEALLFLADLANAFGKDNGRDHFTIEIVCGSRINSTQLYEGCQRTRANDLQGATVGVWTTQEALTRFLDNLKPVAEYCAKNLGGRVQLALELEPGPLFALNDVEALRTLCQLLANHPNIREVAHVIGVNLDVAHWGCLCGISPSSLNQAANVDIRSRIVHAHICDHFTGHFADNEPGAFHSEEYFREWLALFVALPHEHRESGFPAYDGIISLELEAAVDGNLVKRAVETLWRLLSEVVEEPSRFRKDETGRLPSRP